MANDGSGASFVTGFLVGGIVGAIVGILLAPKSGSETRAELLVQSEAWRTRAEEMAARVREGVTPAVESVRERVGPAVETVRERMAPVADQVASRVGRGGAKPEGDGLSASDAGEDEAAASPPKEQA